MPNVKISALSALGSVPASGDVVPITDVSGTPTTKKVTVSNLMGAAPVQSVAGKTGAVTIASTDVSGLGTAATLDVGTSASNIVQLDGSSRLPAVDGSQLTGISGSSFLSIVSETTTSRTLSDSDSNKVINCTNSAQVTITVPSGLSSGFNCTLVQSGAGTVVVEAGSGATVFGRVEGGSGNTATKGQYAAIRIIPTASNSYVIEGDAGNAPFVNVYSLGGTFTGSSNTDALDGGDEHASCGTISTFASATAFSISVWFKGNENSDTSIFGGFQHRYNPQQSGGIKYNLNGTSGGFTSTIGSTNYLDNSWHQMVATFNSATVTIYVDGSSIGTHTNSQSTTNSNSGNNIKIGAYSLSTGGAAGHFRGKIDEVGVWNSVLSSAEVTEIYASGSVIDLASDTGNYTSSSNLQHYWRCGDSDNGTGSTITDIAGSVNATLQNGAQFVQDTP